MNNLKLDEQLCFPLYVCSKEIIKRYKPALEQVDLTYTQYIIMMVMWEENEISFRDLVKRLYLESNTLTPVLKKLEDKKLIERKKITGNDKNIILSITKKGIELKEEAKLVPMQLGKCLEIKEEDGKTLKEILHRLMQTFN